MTTTDPRFTDPGRQDGRVWCSSCRRERVKQERGERAICTWCRLGEVAEANAAAAPAPRKAVVVTNELGQRLCPRGCGRVLVKKHPNGPGRYPTSCGQCPPLETTNR